ncbi:MAG: glutamate cyclase domain-containing protein, partial [Pseudomonadota bacterium]
MVTLADRMEALITRDVGRNVGPLADAARGGLARAAASLAEARSAVIVTGFYIPKAEPPAAETDGPIGAVLI